VKGDRLAQSATWRKNRLGAVSCSIWPLPASLSSCSKSIFCVLPPRALCLIPRARSPTMPPARQHTTPRIMINKVLCTSTFFVSPIFRTLVKAIILLSLRQVHKKAQRSLLYTWWPPLKLPRRLVLRKTIRCSCLRCQKSTPCYSGPSVIGKADNINNKQDHTSTYSIARAIKKPWNNRKHQWRNQPSGRQQYNSRVAPGISVMQWTS